MLVTKVAAPLLTATGDWFWPSTAKVTKPLGGTSTLLMTTVGVAWATVTVTAYGRRETRHVAEITCLWYGSWHTRTVRLILSRDERTASGYDLALVTTDPDASPAALVTRYAARWGIEQAFADARNVLGAGEARNRVRRAVERTVPFALLTHTLIITWYARNGHHPARIHPVEFGEAPAFDSTPHL